MLNPPQINTLDDLIRWTRAARTDPIAAAQVRNIMMRASFYDQIANGGAGGSTNSTCATFYQGGAPMRSDESSIRLSIKQWKDLQEVAARHGLAIEVRQGEFTLSPAPEVVTRDGMHFTTDQRAGDEARDRYLSHLREMFAQGYIDEAEYDARAAAVMKALTIEQMAICVQDLPEPVKAVAVKEKAEPAKVWHNLTHGDVAKVFAVAGAVLTILAFITTLHGLISAAVVFFVLAMVSKK